MGLIPEDKIAEVRDRTNIVQVIGEYVTLRKAGVNYKGLCPFHGEKTPSFNVNPAKQIFHCFGCGKSGDVITFVMEMNGQPFIEVVRDLARRSGVTLPDPEPVSMPPAVLEERRRGELERTKVLRLNRLAADFFRAEYLGARGARVRAYVDGRAITPPVSETFQLGYAPPGWDGLVRALESRRVPHELAEQAGLIRARDGVSLPPGAPPSKATHFDLFRDRVMCPVINLQGEVVGFSGRILEGDAPKYINTPETAAFRKGEQLFGLHAAKQAIRQGGRAILVEGNFDVLAMHSHGLTETVAPMGTSLTATQAHLIHRFAGKVYVFLDGDAAGTQAAARDVGLLLDEDLLSFVAILPMGEDPDTFLRKQGRDACEHLLKNAKESVEYFCAHAWKKSGSSVIERVRLIEAEAAPILRKVRNETARRRYAQRLALELDLPVDTVDHVVRGGKSDERVLGKVAPEAPPATSGGTQLPATDVEIVALLSDKPELLARYEQIGVARWIRSARLREALSALSGAAAPFSAASLAEAMEPAARGQIMAAALSGRYADVPDPERALREILRRCEKDQILGELKSTLQAARAAGDETLVRELTTRIGDLNRQRLGLTGQRSETTDGEKPE